MATSSTVPTKVIRRTVPCAGAWSGVPAVAAKTGAKVASARAQPSEKLVADDLIQPTQNRLQLLGNRRRRIAATRLEGHPRERTTASADQILLCRLKSRPWRRICPRLPREHGDDAQNGPPPVLPGPSAGVGAATAFHAAVGAWAVCWVPAGLPAGAPSGPERRRGLGHGNSE